MAGGRVRNEGGGFGLNMKMEYFITDQQGNVRVSFEDNGSGTAIVKQENSYYAFGMQMAGGYTPTNPNKKLYNAGSEWQDDIDGLADYYSTFYREYDPIIGRFNGVDPMAEGTDQITTYAYANNNPVMMNDPMGNYAEGTALPKWVQEMQDAYNSWHDSQYGDNSSRSTLDRYMGMWGMGDWIGGGGGGGMTEFDFLSTYAGLKMRLNNDGKEGLKYGYNKAGEFGFWNQFEGSDWSTGDGAMTGITIGTRWTSLSGSGPDLGGTVMQSGKGNNSDFFSGLFDWNGPFMRNLIADKYTISLNIHSSWFGGAGTTPVSFTLLTRGEAGLYFTPSVNTSVSNGVGIGVNVSSSRGWFTGNPNDIKASYLLGPTFEGSAIIGAGEEVSVFASYSPSNPNRPFQEPGFINVGASFGMGFDASPMTAASIQQTTQITLPEAFGTIFRFN